MSVGWGGYSKALLFEGSPGRSPSKDSLFTGNTGGEQAELRQRKLNAATGSSPYTTPPPVFACPMPATHN